MITIDFETYSEAGYSLEVKTAKPSRPRPIDFEHATDLKLDKYREKLAAVEFGPPVEKLVVTPVGTKGGLLEVGMYVYVEHPSFEVICLHYRDDVGGGALWTPGNAAPAYLLNHVEQGGAIEAHNAGFEYVVWNKYCVPVLGWPELKLEQLYCSAAKCRRYSLPGALAAATKVIGNEIQKDTKGRTLIQKLSRPLTPTKNRPAIRWTPETAPNDFKEFYEYCATDTLAEQSLSRQVPDLGEFERSVWLVDQTINHRGVCIDVKNLNACVSILRDLERDLMSRFREITGGAVQTVNENAKFKAWLASLGALTESVDKENVERLLNMPFLHPTAREGLKLRQALGLASVKKLITLTRRISKDGRLRGAYIYCGADRTKRWASGGVQTQNMYAGGPKVKTCALCDRVVGKNAKICPTCEIPGFHKREGWTADDVEQAFSDICQYGYAQIGKIWGDVGALLSGCLRGLFVAAPGHDLICADFNAIEAVGLACLSRCQWRVDVFSTHGKIYETTASQISGIPLEEILAHKKETGQHHPLRKKLGKIPELASGYGGWIGAWKRFGADEFFESDEEIKSAILTWRDQSPEIIEFWGGQHRQVGGGPWDSVPELYGLEGAFVSAILNPGSQYRYIDIGYAYDTTRDIVFCQLPSGRFLQYHRPRLVAGFNRFRRPAYLISCEGWNSNPQKGVVGWTKMELYGALLAENAVQATTADIQAEALVRVERAGYPIVMHTHDEITAEVKRGSGLSLEKLVAIMIERPTWASWWPIRAEGWIGKRFRKD